MPPKNVKTKKKKSREVLIKETDEALEIIMDYGVHSFGSSGNPFPDIYYIETLANLNPELAIERVCEKYSFKHQLISNNCNEITRMSIETLKKITAKPFVMKRSKAREVPSDEESGEDELISAEHRRTLQEDVIEMFPTISQEEMNIVVDTAVAMDARLDINIADRETNIDQTIVPEPVQPTGPIEQIYSPEIPPEAAQWESENLQNRQDTISAGSRTFQSVPSLIRDYNNFQDISLSLLQYELDQAFKEHDDHPEITLNEDLIASQRVIDDVADLNDNFGEMSLNAPSLTLVQGIQNIRRDTLPPLPDIPSTGPLPNVIGEMVSDQHRPTIRSTKLRMRHFHDDNNVPEINTDFHEFLYPKISVFERQSEVPKPNRTFELDENDAEALEISIFQQIQAALCITSHIIVKKAAQTTIQPQTMPTVITDVPVESNLNLSKSHDLPRGAAIQHDTIDLSNLPHRVVEISAPTEIHLPAINENIQEPIIPAVLPEPYPILQELPAPIIPEKSIPTPHTNMYEFLQKHFPDIYTKFTWEIEKLFDPLMELKNSKTQGTYTEVFNKIIRENDFKLGTLLSGMDRKDKAKHLTKYVALRDAKIVKWITGENGEISIHFCV